MDLLERPTGTRMNRPENWTETLPLPGSVLPEFATFFTECCILIAAFQSVSNPNLWSKNILSLSLSLSLSGSSLMSEVSSDSGQQD